MLEREVVASLAKWLLMQPQHEGNLIIADWRDGKCVYRMATK